jgi:hypothetical protein
MPDRSAPSQADHGQTGQQLFQRSIVRQVSYFSNGAMPDRSASFSAMHCQIGQHLFQGNIARLVSSFSSRTLPDRSALLFSQQGYISVANIFYADVFGFSRVLLLVNLVPMIVTQWAQKEYSVQKYRIFSATFNVLRLS